MSDTTTPSWIDITAADASTLRGFYSELFGWTVAVDDDMDGYGLISAGGGRPAGGIGQLGSSPHPAGIVVYLPVQDVEATVASAERLGASVAVAPWEIPGLGRMAVLADPEGNRIGIISS